MSEGTESELKQVEISIEKAKKLIELGDALDRLRGNVYFKKLILDEYLKDYAVQMVKNMASFGMQDERQQNFIKNELIAIGSLDQFFRYVSAEAYQARISMAADEETRSEILKEEI